MAYKNEKERRDIYQEATDKILAALERGEIPWQKPWNPNAAGCSMSPRNAVTGARYKGMNAIFLRLDGKVSETGDPRFCTYKQAESKGWQVRKGEKGTLAFFAQKVEVRDKNDERAIGKKVDGDKGAIEGRHKEVFIYKAFTVFHASQIDGIPAMEKVENTWRRPEAADIIMRGSGADIRIGGDQAYYAPKGDYIQLPPDHAFKSPEAWAATALHELGHWTGHESRLKRDLSGSGLSADYAKEELRAELCSAMIGAELGLPTQIENHAAYVQHWVQALKDDKREIFRASAEAGRMADFCLGFHPEYQAEKAADKAKAAASKADAEDGASMDPEPVSDVLADKMAAAKQDKPTATAAMGTWGQMRNAATPKTASQPPQAATAPGTGTWGQMKAAANQSAHTEQASGHAMSA